MKFKVLSVHTSEKKGTRKYPVSVIRLVKDHGVEGDAHAGKWHRQVSLLATEAVDKLRSKKPGIQIKPGDFGENILTRGVDWRRAKPGDTIRINRAVLEVTQIGKICHHRCAIHEHLGDCIMPTQGIFARVKTGGRICAEDSGDYCF
jgi:MOSC domain-containing protein YiiM